MTDEISQNQPDQTRSADEVVGLRLRVAELERELAASRAVEERALHLGPRQERESLAGSVEIMGDFQALQAQGVDVSKGGICLEVGKPIPFDIKLTAEGEEQVYRGNMAWMKSLADGSYRLGFRFVPPDLSGE